MKRGQDPLRPLPGAGLPGVLSPLSSTGPPASASALRWMRQAEPPQNLDKDQGRATPALYRPRS